MHPIALLPAFPLLPASLTLSRARLGTTVLITGALAAVSVGYGVYLLTIAALPL